MDAGMRVFKRLCERNRIKGFRSVWNFGRRTTVNELADFTKVKGSIECKTIELYNSRDTTQKGPFQLARPYFLTLIGLLTSCIERLNS